MRSTMLLLLASACSSGDGTPSPAGGPDAAIVVTPDAPAFQTCEGACQTTNLAASFGATQRMLDRAFYGVTKDATGSTLHVEIHKGGTTTCPEQDSPTPQYSVVLANVPVPTSTAPSTSTATLVDYVGDIVTTPNPTLRATAVTLTPVAANICTTCVGTPAPSHVEGMVAVDATLTFPGGTITGHFYATHCDSMDLFEP